MFVSEKLFEVAEGTVVLYLYQSNDVEEVLSLDATEARVHSR